MGKKRVNSESGEEPLPKVSKSDSMIVDELNGKDALVALQRIVDSSDNEEIVALLSQGGGGKDLLNIFDALPEKPKSSDISLVFNACEKFLLHVSKCISEAQNDEDENKFKKLGIELSHELLEFHLGYIMLLLSGSNTAYQVQSSLRVLTSMITCCNQTAKEVLMKLDFEHKHFDSVSKRQSNEIRKSFIQFLLSFFVIGHAGIAKEFVEKKVLLSSILPGLIKDDSELIEFVLTGFKEKILENPSLSKTSKMMLFSVYNLKHILALFEWKGPNPDDVDLEAKAIITECVSDFITKALTSVKFGLIFHDPTFGTSGSNQNHLMLNLVQGIVEPWRRPNLAKIVVSALGACPDQIRPYFIKVLQPLWAPRHSESWFQVVDFLYAVMEGLDVTKIVSELSEKNNKLLANVISNFCCNEKVFKEVIGEAMKSSNEILVRLKGIELEGLLLKKIEKVFQNEAVAQSSKKQILFRLQNKLPPLNEIVSLWNDEIKQRRVEEGNNVNYILVITQVISFYLNHFGDKYAPTDLELQKMLEDASSIDTHHPEDGLVQLLLLKHILSSQSAISANVKHVQTLVKIACENFANENGDLAIDALFSMLNKNDLCLQIEDIKVWMAFADSREIQDGLSEVLVDIFDRKELVCEESRKEVNAILHGDQAKNSGDLLNNSMNDQFEGILQELLNPNLMDNHGQIYVSKSQELGFSAILVEFLKTKSLHKFKSYFQNCIKASIVVQSSPQHFLQLVSKLYSKNWNSKSVLSEKLSCNHSSFETKLNKYRLLCKFKMENDSNALQELESEMETTDFDMVLNDTFIQEAFDPVGGCESDLSKLILKLARNIPCTKKSIMLPFSLKMIGLVRDNMKKAEESGDLFEDLFTSLPMELSDLKNTMESILNESTFSPFTFQVLGLTLSKICSMDKWSLMKVDNSKKFADILEKMLSKPSQIKDSTFVNMMSSITKLAMFNPSFKSSITVTHFTLACNESKNDACAEFVTALLKLDLETYGSVFRKWITKNLDQMSRFHKAVIYVLNNDKCKSKFVDALGQSILEKKDSFDEEKENILEILVEKHQFSISNDTVPCKALLLHYQNAEDVEKCLDAIVIPLMKDITKTISSKENLEEKKINLFIECLSSLEYELFNHEAFKDLWPLYMKSTLKYGLKADSNNLILKAFGTTLDNLVLSKDFKNEAEQIYSMITGHSQFVQVMFSSKSAIKESLLKVILVLVQNYPKICTTAQIPIFLGAYNGTLSEADRTLLDILYFQEVQGMVNLQMFKPLLWGQAAIGKYSSSLNKTQNMTKIMKASEVLGLIHSETMLKSSLNFPLKFENMMNDSKLYDPRFFLPLICQLCAADKFVDKHLKLIESGALGMAFASLSCHDEQTRQIGIVALHRIYVQLEHAKKSLSAEKQVWLHLVDIVRNGLIAVLNDKPVPPRIPNLVSVFLIKSVKILSNPLDPMFKSISSFVLAKPMMELYEVPEFLRLFHSSDVVSHSIQQDFILSVVSDGVRDELDFAILQQTFIPKMLMSYHDCSLIKPNSKTVILDVIVKMCQMPSAAKTLIRQHGLLIWLMHLQHDFVKVNQVIIAIWKNCKNFIDDLTTLELIKLSFDLMLKSDHCDVVNEMLPMLSELVSKVEPLTRNCLSCNFEKVKPILVRHAKEEVQEDVIYLLNHLSEVPTSVK